MKTYRMGSPAFATTGEAAGTAPDFARHGALLVIIFFGAIFFPLQSQ
jgi:hypothetical protein